MKYQWQQNSVKNSLILDVNKKIGGMIQEEYPKMYYVIGVDCPPVVIGLLKIEGIESVTISTPYQITLQVASLFDRGQIKDQIIKSVHQNLDINGELIQIKSSNCSQEDSSGSSYSSPPIKKYAIYWVLFHELWGLNKNLMYNKQKWIELQRLLKELEHDIKSTTSGDLKERYLVR